MADTEAASSTSQRPEDIQDDIEAIRTRMGRTLNEIEKRLKPDGLAADALAFTRRFTHDAVSPELQTMMDQAGAAIRRNPLPALLIGIGAAWLAYEVVQMRRHRVRPETGDQTTADLLVDLIGVARQGTKALRHAGMALREGPARDLLREAAEERGRTAALLQAELQRMGVDAVHGNEPHGEVPAWRRVEEMVPTGDLLAILEAVEVAEDETKARFRRALSLDLPEHVRVLIGSRFYEVERTHDRLSVLRDAAR